MEGGERDKKGEKEGESTKVKRRGKREGKRYSKSKGCSGAERDGLGLGGCRDPEGPIPTHK